MVTVKKGFVFNVIRSDELPFYEVTDGKNPVAENQTHRDVEQACQEIAEIFEAIEDNSVFIKLYDKNKADRGKQGGRNYKYREFRVVLSGGKSSPGVAGLSVKDAEGYLREIHALELKLAAKETEIKMSEFQRQIDELKKADKENPLLTHGIGLLEKMVTSGAFSKNPPALAGVNDPPIEMDQAKVVSPKEAEQVLKSSLARWQKIDSDFINTLVRLVAFAEANPEQYNNLKSMLPV